MTEVAVFSALVAALYIGYHFGRRGGSNPSTWKMRTSRATLGRLAITLIALMVARRIRRSLLADCSRPAALAVRAMKHVERGLPRLRVH